MAPEVSVDAMAALPGRPLPQNWRTRDGDEVVGSCGVRDREPPERLIVTSPAPQVGLAVAWRSTDESPHDYSKPPTARSRRLGATSPGFAVPTEAIQLVALTIGTVSSMGQPTKSSPKCSPELDFRQMTPFAGVITDAERIEALQPVEPSEAA